MPVITTPRNRFPAAVANLAPRSASMPNGMITVIAVRSSMIDTKKDLARGVPIKRTCSSPVAAIAALTEALFLRDYGGGSEQS
ncbi:hypothetical protein ACFQ05_22820 [Amycolatopsis umgeniensis]|uniref:Uncharacterized protein n=1 Tax=Amycolatopsis umgeniensis TaxID=336628 RepID=A0A841ATR0_9PSEU|nr:hypothetical protein [Amycolatopsis umgeniensis]MBB5850041.1 hypothetical protein [Amycolatopsis umgeniensis]